MIMCVIYLEHTYSEDLAVFQVDEDRVLLYLCKKQNKSWYPELDNGLETAEEEEEQEQS